MLIEYLILKNFGPFRDEIQLDFSNKKVVGIAGPNESGKSTLLRAICFVIYGKIPLKQDVHKVRMVQLINDRASSDLVVEAGLKFPDRSITIQRTRAVNNQGQVLVDGQALKAGQAQEAIAEVVRLDYQDFISLSYFVQGDIHQLLAGDKRSYFERWTAPLSYWQSLSEAFRGQVVSLQASRTKVGSQRDLLSERAKELDQYQARLQAAEQDLQKSQARCGRLSDSVIDLTAKIKANESKEHATSEIKRIKSQLADLIRQHNKLELDLEEATNEFDQVSQGICPILDRACKPLEKSGQKKRKSLNLKLTSLKNELTHNASKQKKLKVRGNTLLKKIKKETNEQLKTDLSKAKTEQAAANTTLEVAYTRLAKAKTLVDEAEKAKLNIKLCNKQLQVLDRKIRKAQFLQYMCGKSGIPSKIMEAELQRMEEGSNWVLERLDYQKQIRLAAYQELVSLEKVCPVCGSESWRKKVCRDCGVDQQHKRKDEPSVTVLDGDRERPFALESGGGQVLQSFSIRLAGSLFVANMLGINLRMVMLDEVFAHLDASNRQKLMDLVITKLGSEFGLEQQFVVSHHDDIINSVDDMLVVTKQQNGSLVEWS